MAKLQTASAGVVQSSITLAMPLPSWQTPWFFDDSSKRAAAAFLKRVAWQHAVWWAFASPDQQAVLNQGAPSGQAPAGQPFQPPSGSLRAQALLGVLINGRLVQVCSC